MRSLLLVLAFLPGLALGAPKAEKKAPVRDIGLGGGIFTVYPPMVTLDGAWRLSKWVTAGLAAGYVTVPIEQFAGTSTYFGLEGKYFLTGGNWHAALAVGRRTFEITTKNDLTVGEKTTEVAWTRRVAQTVAYPQVGWMSWSKGGDSLILAAGLVVPFGTSFSMEKDPDVIPGLTQENLETEETERADDVKGVTHRTWPSMTVKFVHFFDWIR